MSVRPYSVALFDHESKRVQSLTDEEAAILINHDPLVRTAWCKWNAASANNGSLLVLDWQRARRILASASKGREDDDEVRGLA
jgi:hypothetical protein